LHCAGRDIGRISGCECGGQFFIPENCTQFKNNWALYRANQREDRFLFCRSSIFPRDDPLPAMTSLCLLRTRQRLLLVPATSPRLRIPLRAPIRTLLILSSSRMSDPSPSSFSPLSQAQSPIHSPAMTNSTTLKTGSSYLRPGPVESFVSNGLKTQDYYFDLPLKHTDSSCKETIVVFARRVSSLSSVSTSCTTVQHSSIETNNVYNWLKRWSLSRDREMPTSCPGSSFSREALDSKDLLTTRKSTSMFRWKAIGKERQHL